MRVTIRTLSQILLCNLLKSSYNLLCNSQEHSFMIFKAKICLSMNFLVNKSWHIFQFTMKKGSFFGGNLVTPPLLGLPIHPYTYLLLISYPLWYLSAFVFKIDVKRNAGHITQISHAAPVSRQSGCWRLKQQTKSLVNSQELVRMA